MRLREIVAAWFYTLEEDVLAEGTVQPDDADALAKGVDALLERRLADVARTTPAFAAALRAYRNATLAGDQATAESLIAWIGGQPNVAASARRAAGVRGDLDHFAALGFLQGLLTILRDSGHPGLLVVLDEIETLQRVRSDVRDKGLNALRQLIDDVDSGRFPGLYLLITGTPAFYDGPQGISRLTPLAQRLVTDFGTDARFDSPRAVQVRLSGFDLLKLAKLGTAVRDLYAQGSGAQDRIARLVDDDYLTELARAVAGELGGQVGVAPRIFLRKLVADVLDRVAEFPDFDPRQHYKLDAVRNRTDRRGAQRGGVPAFLGRRGGTRPVSELAGLHPTLAHHLVSTLGWTELRPLQQAAIAPVAAGQDALLLAPTAGGKTEAAAFPVLSRMAAEGWTGLSALYLCPLKALLNNLLPRLETYGGWTGRRVALWHGDTADSRRRAILAGPPDLLLTTPESLESMLVSANVDHRRLFADLQVVVVDEVHAFGSGDRGWHLLAVLERLTRLCGRPLQRIGLSATVGNPDALLRWLQGSSAGKRPGTVVAAEAKQGRDEQSPGPFGNNPNRSGTGHSA